MGFPHPGENQPEIVVNFRDGSDDGAGIVGYALLFDGNGRRESRNVVHVRFVLDAKKLSRIDGKRFNIPSLPLRVESIEGEGRFA